MLRLVQTALFVFVLGYVIQGGISHAKSDEPIVIFPSSSSSVENVWGKKRLVSKERYGSLRIFDPKEKLFDDASFWKIKFNQKLPYGKKILSFRIKLGSSHKALWGQSVLQPIINGGEAQPAINESGRPTFTLIPANDGRRFIPDGVKVVKLQMGKSERLLSSFSFVLAGAHAMDITLSDFQITVWPEDDNRALPQRPFLSSLSFGRDDKKIMLLDLNDDDQSRARKSVILKIDGPDGRQDIEYKLSPERSIASASSVSPIDLSHIQKVGDYFLTMPSFGKRTIASKIKFSIRAPNRSLERIRDEAWGAFYWITDNNSGPYKNPHAQDKRARVFDSSGQTRDVSGGWFDAGDYGKYTVNGAFSVNLMLLTGLHAPEVLEHKINPLVKNNGGLPDWLKVANTELQWLLKMQQADGGVNHKATTRFFPNMGVSPEQDDKIKWIMPVSSAATADFAATMSLAAIVYNRQPDRKARKQAAIFTTAAERAQQWLEANQEQKQVKFRYGGFKYGGPYHDDDDSDERFFALSAGTARTGAQEDIDKIKPLIEKRVLRLKKTGVEIDWRTVDLLGFWALKLIEDKLDSKSRSLIDGVLEMAAAQWSLNKKNSPWRISLDDSLPFYWGSNGMLANTGWHWLMWSRNQGYARNTSRYAKDALDQLNWFFGRNPLGKTFVTGRYYRAVTSPHFRPWTSGAISLPAGFLVGGPNSNHAAGSSSAENLQTGAPMRKYNDVVESYATNEVAINWQSAWALYLSLARAEKAKNTN